MLLSLPDQGELRNYEMLMSHFVIWPDNLWDTFSTNPDLICLWMVQIVKNKKGG